MFETGVGFVQFHDRGLLAPAQCFPVLGDALDVDYHGSPFAQASEPQPDRFEPNFCFIARSTPRGTKSLTCPPNRQISLTCRELMNVYSSLVIKKIVPMRESSLRFIR